MENLKQDRVCHEGMTGMAATFVVVTAESTGRACIQGHGDDGVSFSSGKAR